MTETELQTTDKNPPKVLIQQPSESDNKSEGNDIVNECQTSPTENGESGNTKHEDIEEAKSADSPTNIENRQISAELKSVEDCQGKAPEAEILDREDQEKPSTDIPEEHEASNTSDDVRVPSTPANAANDPQPPTETTTGDTPMDLSRCRNPEIIITPTPDDPSDSNTVVKEAVETSNATSPTEEDSVATQQENKTESSEDSKAQKSTEIHPDSTTYLRHEAATAETVENETNTDDTNNGSRPTSADRPKSKSPDLESPKSDTQRITETLTSVGAAESELKPPGELFSTETPASGILELVTSESNHDEEPVNALKSAPETTIFPDTSEKSPSPTRANTHHSESPTETAPFGDDIISVTSDEHAKDAGYDASVSGNEDESNDPPTDTSTLTEISKREEPEQKAQSEPADRPVPTDVAATSTETLVPPCTTPESRPRSPKSVKFSDDGSTNDTRPIVSNEERERMDSMRQSVQTPLGLPNVGERSDLGENPNEDEVVMEEEAVAEEEKPATPPEPSVPISSASPSPEPSSQLEVKIEELEKRIQNLENNIADLETEKSTIIQEKNKQINELKEKHEKDIKILESKIDELKNEIREQQSCIQAKNTETASCKSENIKQKREIADLKVQLQNNKSSACVIL